MAYTTQIAMAKRLLAKKGKSMVLTRKGQGTIDPIAGTRGAGGDKTSVFNCVGLPPGKSADKEVGTLVGRNIMEFYMARTSGAINPMPGDEVPWGGRVYTMFYTVDYDPDDSGNVILTRGYGECGG